MQKRKKEEKREKRRKIIMRLVEVEGEPFEVGSMRSGSYEVGGYACIDMCMCV